MAIAAATRLEVGHIGLNVTDLARSTRFYREALGLDLAGESTAPGREYAFLARGGRLLLTLWRQSAGAAPTDRPGLHHLAFQVESIEQVREAEQRLKALGAVIHHGGIVPHREGGESGGLFFEDPDGIRLEISAPSGAGDRPAPHSDGPTCGFF
jgi:catechol 2,3-dioxygenase-like lactoylglutathione lyase family enzyme